MEITKIPGKRRRKGKDHLHIRGDHSVTAFLFALMQGSSPHTWRSLQYPCLLHLQDRIISTYVEITCFFCAIFAFSRDHLHIRGDHFVIIDVAYLGMGSSPHTWRSLEDHNYTSKLYGIISTYVEITQALAGKRMVS